MPCNFQKLLFVLLFVLTSFFVSSIVGTSYSFLRRILGTLHSTKTSGLNFWQLPVASGTAFSGISKKGGNLTRYTQIFEKFFFPEVFFPFNFVPGISRIIGWMVRIFALQPRWHFMDGLLSVYIKKKNSIYFLCIPVWSLEFFATWFEYRSIVCN